MSLNKKQKGTITAIVLLAALIAIITSVVVVTKKKGNKADKGPPNNIISYEALQPSELDVVGCGSSLKEEIAIGDLDLLYNVHKCNVPSKDKLLNTRTRGNWHTLEQFVLSENEDSSLCKAANITLCNARGRLFQYSKLGNDQEVDVQCLNEVKLSREENECNSDIVYFEEGEENTTNKYYTLYVDMYNSDETSGTLSYTLEYKCLSDMQDCPTTLSSNKTSTSIPPPKTASPTVSFAPTSTSFPTPQPIICLGNQDGIPCDWQRYEKTSALLALEQQDGTGGSIDENLSTRNIALDESGEIVAYGAELTDYNGMKDVGSVKVFSLKKRSKAYSLERDVGFEWQQIGQTLYGKHSNHHFGTSVSLSSDGNTLAVGSPDYSKGEEEGTLLGLGHAEVYELDNVSGMWVMKGNEVDIGKNDGDGVALNVALSRDGNVVALGSRSFEDFTGRVSVYEYDLLDKIWKKLGQDILGSQTESSDGRAVALSGNGKILAIGGPHYDSMKDSSSDGNEILLDSGRVRVMQYNSTLEKWELMGDVLEGAVSSLFGFSVDLSEDGSKLAVGARWFSTDDTYRCGAVHSFRYFEGSNRWVSHGTLLRGKETLDQFGVSVKMSSDGNLLAVGAFGSDLSFLGWSDRSYVSVYENKTVGRLVKWVQVGSTIYGKAKSRTGESVALSGNGKVVAYGSPYLEKEGETFGKINVLKFDRED